MSMTLLEALKKLDTTNDEHWTQDNLPRLDVLKHLTGDTVTRADIFNLAKSFNRLNAVVEEAEDTDATEGAETDTVEGNGEGEALPEVSNTEAAANAVEHNVVTDGLTEFMDEADKAEAELVEAREKLHIAQNGLKVAQEKVDGFRKAKAAQVAAVPQHIMIQRFQKSQAEGRASTAKQVNALRTVAQTLSAEEASVLKTGLNDIL